MKHACPDCTHDEREDAALALDKRDAAIAAAWAAYNEALDARNAAIDAADREFEEATRE